MSQVEPVLTSYWDEVEKLIQVVRTLDDDQFLQPMNGWSLRDVVAHLIGWNRYLIDQANASELNEIVQLLIDPGPDFCHVNAASVARYSSKDREVLISQLTYSYNDMADRMRRMSPEGWTRAVDISALQLGDRKTIALDSSVNAMVEDYADHRHEIEQYFELTG